MSNPNTIYDMLVEPIRLADQPGQFLWRYMQGMQNVYDDNYDFILTLPEITDYEVTPDDAIRFLLWHIGLTGQFDDILAGITPDGLRRIASILVQFWKIKGTQGGVTDLLRFAFGREPQFFDYFFFRWLVGEDALDELWDGGDIWVLNPEEPDYDAYRSLIEISDISRNLDQDLLRFLLNLARPSSERFRVVLLDALELFDKADKWNKISGSGSDPTVDGIFKIPAGTTGVWIFTPVEALSWSEYRVKYKFKFSTPAVAGQAVRFWFYSDATWDNAYGIWLQDGLQRMRERTGGVEVNLGPTASKAIDLDVWYTVTVHVQLGNKGLPSEYTQIIIYLDGVPIIDFTDSLNLHSTGTVAIEKQISAGGLWIDFIKVNPIPARIVDIIPQGV
jgi:phage tail-like protein